MFVCPITQRPLSGWRSPRGVTFPLWDGLPVLVPDPERLLASAAGGAPSSDLLSPFVAPSSLKVPGRMGAWLAQESRTPAAIAAAWGSRHAPPGPALDVGCGVGAMALSMASRARPTWAIDLDPHTLVTARDVMSGRIREAGGVSLPVLPLRPGQVRLAVADIHTPPFAPASFTWVHLGVVPDPAVLVVAAGLLVGGGLLTLETDHTSPLGEGPPEDALIDVLAEVGLVVLEEEVAVPRVRQRGPRRFEVDLLHCVAARMGAGG